MTKRKRAAAKVATIVDEDSYDDTALYDEDGDLVEIVVDNSEEIRMLAEAVDHVRELNAALINRIDALEKQLASQSNQAPLSQVHQALLGVNPSVTLQQCLQSSIQSVLANRTFAQIKDHDRMRRTADDIVTMASMLYDSVVEQFGVPVE